MLVRIWRSLATLDMMPVQVQVTSACSGMCFGHAAVVRQPSLCETTDSANRKGIESLRRCHCCSHLDGCYARSLARKHFMASEQHARVVSDCFFFLCLCVCVWREASLSTLVEH